MLKDREAITVRPGELLEPIQFDQLEAVLEEKLNRPVTKKMYWLMHFIQKSLRNMRKQQNPLAIFQFLTHRHSYMA